jgi:hypothetical protein
LLSPDQAFRDRLALARRALERWEKLLALRNGVAPESNALTKTSENIIH